MANERTPPTDARPSGSLVRLAYDRLKAAIEGHQFEPGQRMREAEIAEWLGISRTPARDALRQLEAEGLLTAAPRRGLIVATLDHHSVSEIYDVRASLESLAAGRAAQQATPVELAILNENLRRQAEADAEDLSLLLELNSQFHDAIIRASRNRYLVVTLRSLETPLALLRGTTYTAPGRPAEALEQHRQILAAIESRDEEAASRLAGEHVRAAERIRLMSLAESTVSGGFE